MAWVPARGGHVWSVHADWQVSELQNYLETLSQDRRVFFSGSGGAAGRVERSRVRRRPRGVPGDSRRGDEYFGHTRPIHELLRCISVGRPDGDTRLRRAGIQGEGRGTQ